jgi:hypothetical protein
MCRQHFLRGRKSKPIEAMALKIRSLTAEEDVVVASRSIENILFFFLIRKVMSLQTKAINLFLAKLSKHTARMTRIRLIVFKTLTTKNALLEPLLQLNLSC